MRMSVSEAVNILQTTGQPGNRIDLVEYVLLLPASDMHRSLSELELFSLPSANGKIALFTYPDCD